MSGRRSTATRSQGGWRRKRRIASGERELSASREREPSASGERELSDPGERARLARELHDRLGQQLTAIQLELSWIRARLDAGSDLRARANAALRQVARSLALVRDLSSELRRPGVSRGLRAAAMDAAARFQALTGIACRVEAAARLPRRPVRDEAVYRVLQEALTNIARHARASGVLVRLAAAEGTLTLEVVDDGRGLARRGGGSLGLRGMRERARELGGTLTVSTAPGGGTAVLMQVP